VWLLVVFPALCPEYWAVLLYFFGGELKGRLRPFALECH